MIGFMGCDKMDNFVRVWTVLVDEIGTLCQERGVVAGDLGRRALDYFSVS